MTGPGIEARSPDGGLYEPEDIAVELRYDFGYGESEPATSLVAAIEATGTPVVQLSLETNKVDALTSMRSDGGALVQLNTYAAPARQRFSLAHELGHIVMHQESTSDNKEAEADRFASALLMPERAIRGSLRNPNPDLLLEIATKWQVSTKALVRRSRDLSEISESQYKKLIIELGKVGYRDDESVGVEIDQSQLVTGGIEKLTSLGWSIEDLEEHAMCSAAELTDRFGVEI